MVRRSAIAERLIHVLHTPENAVKQAFPVLAVLPARGGSEKKIAK